MSDREEERSTEQTETVQQQGDGSTTVERERTDRRDVT
jgi:hypothetical protein